MKQMILFMAVFFMVAACDTRRKELALERKQAELNQKEQQLLLKEKTLEFREEELSRKEKKMDSAALADTSFINNPDLPGSWLVRMTCIETTCPGSAVGDTRTEQWLISYENNHVIAKAMSG